MQYFKYMKITYFIQLHINCLTLFFTQFVNQKFFGVLEEPSITFDMATGSP